LKDASQDRPPTPSSDDVFIEETSSFEAYVVSYGGYNSEKRFTEHASDLFERLKDKGVKLREDMYYVAGYDSPFRLMNRHNEVCPVHISKPPLVASAFPCVRLSVCVYYVCSIKDLSVFFT
jgi:hypothetical protein